jgi:hypothetical protein
MLFTFNELTYLIWGIFFFYWFLSSMVNTVKTEKQESISYRLPYLTLLGMAIPMIVFDPMIYGPLL